MQKVGGVTADMLAKLAAMQEKSKKKPKLEVVSTTDAPAQLSLPMWPDTARGVPNSVLRSSLFGVVERGTRSYQEAARKLATLDGITILHTGPQLDQADLDVWEQCLHLAREHGLGVKIPFTRHSFLKAIGRSTGKSQHEWLKGSLRRLMTSMVEISHSGTKVYGGQLLKDWDRDEVSGENFILVNPKIVAVYSPSGWTQVEWEQRQALRRRPLAQWLHGFYATHAAPYAYRIETLHRLCGSEAKHMWEFAKTLRAALEKVVEVTGWSCEIDGDLVRVTKPWEGKKGLKKGTA